MRYIVVVGDGMADYPVDELGGKTPLQVADKPNIDEVARRGSNGLLRTVPEGFEAGSDVANLSILGYDPRIYYPGGRGPIEAASQGIRMNPGDLAFRANIITVDGGKIRDYSAGHIKNNEAKELIKGANKAFGGKGVEFHPGISYRNLLILRDTPLEPEEFICNAPHDNIGGEVEDLLISGDDKSREWASRLNEWMLKSQDLFEKNKINVGRREQGKPLANMLWFWGPGKKRREMPTLKERFGWSGVVISGVDLIKGLGVLAGLRTVNVLGATAYFDTNYEGKADAALEALEKDDFALIHIEAPDEAGHEGMLEEKIRAIENIDKRILGRLMDRMEGDYKLGFLCDHPTPIRVRTHVWDPVPFAIMGGSSDSVERYDEDSAKKGAYGLRKGPEFIELMASKA